MQRLPPVRCKRIELWLMRLLTANHRHAAICPLEALITDVVFEFLVPDSGANGAGQVIIGSVGADDGSQIGLFGSEEAGTQLSIRRHADTVT